MKSFLNLILIFSVISVIFLGGFFTPSVKAEAQGLTISQLVELLITIGAITPEKAAVARSVVANLNLSVTSSTSTTAIATSSLPYIQVLAPNGGESWHLASTSPYKITWGASSQIPVSLALISSVSKIPACNLSTSTILSKKTGNTFNLILNTAKCYNQVTGTSSPVTDGSYKVRISYTNSAGQIVKDESNAFFKILPLSVPTIKVTYPNGGENLLRNKDYTVKYSAKDIDSTETIYLYLLDSNGREVYSSHKLIASNGTYVFKIPSSLETGAYKIKLKVNTYDDKIAEDVGDNFFWVSTAL
jgi:hypothetical protein